MNTLTYITKENTNTIGHTTSLMMNRSIRYCRYKYQTNTKQSHHIELIRKSAVEEFKFSDHV